MDPNPGGPQTLGPATLIPGEQNTQKRTERSEKQILHAVGGLCDSYLHDRLQ